MKMYYIVAIALAYLTLSENLNTAARHTSSASNDAYSLDEDEARAQQHTEEAKSASAIQASDDLIAALQPRKEPTSEETKGAAAATATETPSFLSGITPDNAHKILAQLDSYIKHGINGDFEHEYFAGDARTIEGTATRSLIVQSLKATGANDQYIKEVWQAGFAYRTLYNRITGHIRKLAHEIRKDHSSSKKQELWQVYQKEEALAKKELQQAHEEWLAQAERLIILYYSIFYNAPLIPAGKWVGITNPEKLRELDKDKFFQAYREAIAAAMPHATQSSASSNTTHVR